MRLFSKIENSKDITDKEYVDKFYKKPTSGIPKSDLASAVQTSLGKADAAVPNTRKVNNKALSSDITLSASDVGALPDTTVIPTKVSDLTNDSGFTTNTGTVTSVSVKMNGETKGPVTSSGTIDLGTVLTDASKFATSAQGTKADNAMPKSGGAFTGNISVPKTITFTDTTNPYIKMTTGGTDFYFQSTSGQFGLGPTWDKATHWDSNGNVTFPTTPKVGSSPLALKSDIPSAVTESTVSGWGFTKNKGTVTSVAVKMNGATKGTVTSSGTIDLGTVITSHQDISGKLDKTTYEWNKEFRAGSNGAISLGRYNVYDTQLTFDISSTTTISMNGKLVIATQNGRICQAKVFGDATGVLVSKIVIYQSAIVNNRSWVEVFCNFDGWSKNKVHIYGVALESATVTNQMSSVTFTNGVPSPITSGDSKWSGTIDNDLSGKANLSGGNTFTGDQSVDDLYAETISCNDEIASVNLSAADDGQSGGTPYFSVRYNNGTPAVNLTQNTSLKMNSNAGTSGQVLTSQGAGKTPTWTTPPQFTLRGTTLTITV